MTVIDPLVPLVPVRVGGADILVDEHRPVAAVVAGSDIRFVTWPNAPLPYRQSEASTYAAPDGAWVVYEEVEDPNAPTDGEYPLEQARASSSAVFVGLDGSTVFVDLGSRRPGGADEFGLWAVDPRDASTWNGSIRDDDVEDFPDIEDLPEEVHGEESDDDFWRDGFSVGKNGDWANIGDWNDVDDDQDEHNDDVDGNDQQVVMTREQHQGWFSLASGPDQPDGWSIDELGSNPKRDSDPLDPVPPALPTPPTEILRLGRDGSRTLISVDHLVDAVAQVAETLYLRVHATGPKHIPSTDGTSWNIRYQPRTVSIDVHDGLPARIVTDELSTAVDWNWDDSSSWHPTLGTEPDGEDDEDAWLERFDKELEASEAARALWSNRLDLEGVVGTRWPLVPRSPKLIEKDIDAVRDQFVSLPLDQAGWWAEDDRMHRQRSNYRNVEIITEGTWPQDDVVVTFEHRLYPHVRLRRRVRVHDDSGRPFALGYLTVYLDEALATGQVPPPSSAVNQVVDV